MIKAVVQESGSMTTPPIMKNGSSMFSNPINNELSTLESKLRQLLDSHSADSDLKITLYQDVLNKSLSMNNHSRKTAPMPFLKPLVNIGKDSSENVEPILKHMGKKKTNNKKDSSENVKSLLNQRKKKKTLSLGYSKFKMVSPKKLRSKKLYDKTNKYDIYDYDIKTTTLL